MKSLVTTSYAVLLVDSDNLSIRIIHSGSGVYYGATRHKESIVIASRRRLAVDSFTSSDEQGCLIYLSLRSCSITLVESDIRLRDLHGIEEIDGVIYCCCSFDNAIAVCHQGGSVYWYPLGKPSTKPYDINHINTIKYNGNHIFLLAHNWGRGSEVYILSRKTLEIEQIIKIGQQAHSIWFDGDNMRVFSSAEGKVVGQDGFTAEVGGFPRGHASDGVYRLIGISENVLRSRRDKSNASILLTDMDYSIRSSIDLGAFGMVHDIICLDESEYQSLSEYKSSLF